jgi:hypothetical protein
MQSGLMCWWRALVCICAYIPRVSDFEVLPHKYLTFKINKQPQAVKAKELISRLDTRTFWMTYLLIGEKGVTIEHIRFLLQQ